uniref:Uncharacterized protein n=1 Tax=Arundo donax TaxID=35708 RepID=A0A0A8Y494_ARUDO
MLGDIAIVTMTQKYNRVNVENSISKI